MMEQLGNLYGRGEIMKTLLFSLLLLFCSVLSYAEEKKEIIRLGSVFSSGTLAINNSIVQQEEFVMSDKIAEIYSVTLENNQFYPIRIYHLPYTNFISIINGISMEAIYFYHFKNTNQFFIERYITNNSNYSVDFISYENAKIVVRYKTKWK